MTGPKLTGKAQEVLGGDIEIDIPKASVKEEKRAKKIAKREAKQAEKRANKEAKKESTPAQSLTPTVQVEPSVKERKTFFDKIGDFITLASTMTLGIVGLIELVIGIVKELPDIIKWVVKFVLFSGALGSKKKES